MELAAAVLAALAASAAPAPPPVAVVSRDVALARPDEAPIELRCNRTRRPCRGVLVLGTSGDCSNEPVVEQHCHKPLGQRRFRIPPRRRRTIVVRSTSPGETATDALDPVRVFATPHLGRVRIAGVRPLTRTVRLTAPPAPRRPALPLELRRAMRLVHDRHAVRFTAVAPRGTTTVAVELAGRRVDLHPRAYVPYLLAPWSFTVGGLVWHGEVEVGEGELRTGERHRFRITACGEEVCTETAGAIELARDDTRDPRPICAIRPPLAGA